MQAPLSVAEDLKESISGSTLVVLPEAGYACNIESPEEFNMAVRTFIHESRS